MSKKLDALGPCGASGGKGGPEVLRSTNVKIRVKLWVRQTRVQTLQL